MKTKEELLKAIEELTIQMESETSKTKKAALKNEIEELQNELDSLDSDGPPTEETKINSGTSAMSEKAKLSMLASAGKITNSNKENPYGYDRHLVEVQTVKLNKQFGGFRVTAVDIETGEEILFNVSNAQVDAFEFDLEAGDKAVVLLRNTIEGKTFNVISGQIVADRATSTQFVRFYPASSILVRKADMMGMVEIKAQETKANTKAELNGKLEFLVAQGFTKEEALLKLF